MYCLNCFNKKTTVSNSRPHKNRPQIWRRRTCAACHTTFTTYERPSLAENMPVSLSDGGYEEFNLGKLVISISRAFTHAPKSASYDSLWLAYSVEDKLSTEYRRILTADDIAAVTHALLRGFDELAAVQYAAQHRLIVSTRRRPGRPSTTSAS